MTQSVAEAVEIFRIDGFLAEQAKKRFDHRRMAAFHVDACVSYGKRRT